MLWGISETRRFTDPEACNETPPTVVVIGNETRCEAPGCGTEIEQPETGRGRRFCSGKCRVRLHRSQKVSVAKGIILGPRQTAARTRVEEERMTHHVGDH
jgi:hypothetical protein